MCICEELEQSNWVSTFTVYQMWHWWWAIWWCKGQELYLFKELSGLISSFVSAERGKGEALRKTNVSWTLSFFALIYYQIFLWCDQSSFINFALSQWHFVSRKWLSCHISGLESAKGWKSLFFLSSYSVTAESVADMHFHWCMHAPCACPCLLLTLWEL